VTEKVLLANVRELAGWLGWKTYHTHDSRRSDAGFPDLAMVRGGRAIFAELKTAKGRVTQAQLDWLAALAAAGAESHIWRPADWTAGHIEAALRGNEPQPKWRK
jgi:hypothetical protein